MPLPDGDVFPAEGNGLFAAQSGHKECLQKENVPLRGSVFRKAVEQEQHLRFRKAVREVPGE